MPLVSIDHEIFDGNVCKYNGFLKPACLSLDIYYISFSSLFSLPIFLSPRFLISRGVFKEAKRGNREEQGISSPPYGLGGKRFERNRELLWTGQCSECCKKMVPKLLSLI